MKKFKKYVKFNRNDIIFKSLKSHFLFFIYFNYFLYVNLASIMLLKFNYILLFFFNLKYYNFKKINYNEMRIKIKKRCRRRTRN